MEVCHVAPVAAHGIARRYGFTSRLPADPPTRHPGPRPHLGQGAALRAGPELRVADVAPVAPAAASGV
ncbi:hypothetical protein VR43_09825 [Streptomyces sp. NRRL S-104]|nr:hypothetical protein VR43_09825 [Streptomyces sp. NRRL S-104]